MNPTTQAALAGAVRDAARDGPNDVVARDGTERRRRLAVYRNTHVATLVDAMRDSFPVTRQLLGDAFFDALAQARIEQDPPRSPVLADWTGGFPAFAARFEPLDAAPYTRDVARLEAACIEAYHAADAAPIPHPALQAWLAEPTRLASARARLHPAASVLRFAHAAGRLWLAHQHPDGLDDALATIEPAIGEDVLVARPALDVHVHVLPHGGLELFEALAAGAPLGAALARAAEAGADPVAMFSRVLDAGAITAFESHPDRSP